MPPPETFKSEIGSQSTMCRVQTGAYVSLLTPGETKYSDCHPRKTTTYILHVVSITTHTHDRRKSIGAKETKKRNISTMPRRSTSGFHQPGRHCLHQGRSAVRCLAKFMKGRLHATKNRLWMAASLSSFIFRYGHSQRQHWEHYVTALWVPYRNQYVIHNSPCAE